MNELENIEIFGRRIFFLNPAFVIRKEIFTSLQDNEYEAYIIDTYHEAKNIMRHNPNSILFINVDAQIPMNAWYNFVRSFEKEDVLRSINIYIMSERIKQSDKLLFEAAPEVAGEIIAMDDTLENLTERFSKILTDLNAKGKRKYVRANLIQDTDSALFWNYGTKMHQLKLLDISSVGMSVRVPNQIGNIVAANTVLKDITIRLGTSQFVVEAVVFAVKNDADKIIWILLLLPNTANKIKNSIKNYIYEKNQDSILRSIDNDEPDNDDYTKLNYYNLATKKKVDNSPSENNLSKETPPYNL